MAQMVTTFTEGGCSTLRGGAWMWAFGVVSSKVVARRDINFNDVWLGNEKVVPVLMALPKRFGGEERRLPLWP